MTAEAVLQKPDEAAYEKPLLEVVRLRKEFPVRTGMFKKAAVSAVDDVSFEVRRAQPSASSANPAAASRLPRV